MRVKKRMMVCFLLPCILLFSLIYLIPMGIVFVTSFFEWKSGGVFHIIGLRNYIEAFVNDTRMHQALKKYWNMGFASINCPRRNRYHYRIYPIP